MAYRLIDLFSGAGGMTLGFTDKRFGGGFESVWAVDMDSAAVATYRRNFGDHADCADIEEWLESGKPIPEADVVIGGPPCQGFSLLNKQRVGDRRRALWQPFMDVVERSGARVFVIENVAELLSSPEADAIKARAQELGFDTVGDVLLAANYGAPQTRRRAVIVGWKSAHCSDPIFPPLATHASSRSGSKSSSLANGVGRDQ